MKVENTTEIDGGLPVPIPVAIVKCELTEFDKSHTNDPDNFNPIEVKTVTLEKIPKTELVYSGEDHPSFSSNEKYEDLYKQDSDDSKEDLDSDLEERDPFADVDCDPCFSRMPQSNNSNDYATQEDELTNSVYASASSNHQSSTSTTCSTVPIGHFPKYDNSQRKTLLSSKFQCGLCLEDQSCESIRKTHVDICAASHKNRHRFCVPCNKLFFSPQAYRLHALNSHGVKEAKFYRYPFKCEICPRSFALKETLTIHSESHQENNSTNNSSSTLPFKCEECPSSFASLHFLTRHAKSHSNERPVKCPNLNCGKAFKSNGNLKEHFRRIHSDERPFKCTEPNCGKTFKMNGQLQKHLVCHSEARPFQCTHSDCSKTFKNKERLTKHLAAHRGARRYKHITERPFKCDKCYRTFVKNWQRTVHLKTHITQNKIDKIFQCPESNCDSTFKYRPNLKVHIANFHTSKKDHLSFSCPEPSCGKKFKYKKSVREHLCTHTGERPFKCSEPGCSAEFVRNSYLTHHMKKHEGHRSKRMTRQRKN